MDNTLPVNDELTKSNADKQVVTQDTLRRGVGRPKNQLRGYKIEKSVYRDEVARMLLTKHGFQATIDWLAGMGFKATEHTLRGFERNYVVSLDQKVKDELIAKAQEAADKRDTVVADKVIHAEISRVDSLVHIMAGLQTQIDELEVKTPKSVFERQTLVACYEQMVEYRSQLEAIRTTTEVEMARTKAIQEIGRLALRYMRDNPNAGQFIKDVENYGERKFSID